MLRVRDAPGAAPLTYTSGTFTQAWTNDLAAGSLRYAIEYHSLTNARRLAMTSIHREASTSLSA